MEFKLRFLGAAQNVTGSRYLLEANGTKILVDCGLYQEREFKNRNWDPFPVSPASIDAVLLTHAHLDHCGLLPKLAKEGFNKKIYCTTATAELTEIILLDSAKIQEEDAEHKRKRHEKQGRLGLPHPEVPLYTVQDTEACIPLFQKVEYEQILNIADGIEATFYDAGHVLGSSIIRVKVTQGDEQRIVMFSGDVGRPNRPIVHNPTIFNNADYVLVESTYGDRVHHDELNIKGLLADVINTTRKAGGNIVVPSFALERSQEVLYYMNELLREKKIEPIKIILDSPMAARITKIFEKHPELFDGMMKERVNNHQSPFDIAGLEMAGTVEESKKINEIKGGIMIIAGSGMCTGGRIKYHIANNINRPESTILFVGYQATGTLGRLLVDGAKKVRILGEEHPVKAKVIRIHGFSAHADRKELAAWLGNIIESPRKVFVVHGESESAKFFGKFLKDKTGWDVSVPEYNEQVICN